MRPRLFQNEVDSVFALNRQSEDSATYAIGWTLSRSTQFSRILAKDLLITDFHGDQIQIELQRPGRDKGFTDIEIIFPNLRHVIVEAKKNWELPGVDQLKKYCTRFTSKDPSASLMLSLSSVSQKYAIQHLPKTIEGVPLIHRSWSDILELVRVAYKEASSYSEKLWLYELEKHLVGYVNMNDPSDNTVYCVVLSKAAINKESKYTWIDVVRTDNSYFHPVGGSWPIEPLNYVGFRWDGQLRSVHHVDSYTVVKDLSSVNTNWPKTDSDHFVYSLGPAMLPAKEIRNGNIYPTGRIECAVDTLLSGAYDTISEARKETRRRKELN